MITDKCSTCILCYWGDETVCIADNENFDNRTLEELRLYREHLLMNGIPDWEIPDPVIYDEIINTASALNPCYQHRTYDEYMEWCDNRED